MLKKSQSGILSSVLIMLIALVSIAILWNIFVPLIERTTNQIDINPFILNGELKSYLSSDAKTSTIEIKRGTGEGQISGIKLVFLDENGKTYTYDKKQGIDDLVPLETIKFDLNGDELTPKINDFSKIKKVSLYYVYEVGGNDRITRQLDSKSLISNANPSGACTYGAWVDRGCGSSCTGEITGDCNDLSVHGQSFCDSANGRCRWVSIPGCYGNYDCSVLDTQSNCEENSPWGRIYCNWYSMPTCHGTLDCSEYNEAECTHSIRNNYCSWNGNSCYNNPSSGCSSVIDTEICNSLNGCSFQEGYCSGYGECISKNFNEDICNSMGMIGCSWSNQAFCSNNGLSNCNQLSTKSCNYVGGCSVSSGLCDGISKRYQTREAITGTNCQETSRCITDENC
jgi:hypothetical protein